MVRSLRLTLVLLLLLLLPALAWAGGPQRHRLPGGLTIITKENHEAPVVAFQVWVRAGSAYEGPSERGITHFIEHMIFKGTPTVPVGEMARRIEGLGGDVNAYTTFDHTNYYVVASSRKAGQALALLADSVANANYGRSEIAREKEVVVEEIRMNFNSPRRRFWKAVFRHAFGDHPYGRPVIGSIESLRAFKRGDLLGYVKRWYRGPGLVVVAVGDFKTAEILPLIKKAFAGLAQGRPPRFELPPVKLPPGPRLKVFREKVRQARISISWRVPGLPDPAIYPLDVAAQVAGGGETSRLYSRLKEKLGLVDSVDVESYTPQGMGLFMVSATLRPGRIKSALPALLRETLALIGKPPTAQELSRARVQLAASFIRRRQTMAGQARNLGYFEMFFGAFEQAQSYLQRFNAVSSGQVSQALRRHLRPQTLSVAIQAPAGAAVPSQAEVAALVKRVYQARVPVKPAGPVVVKLLPNRLKLIIKPATAVPLVSYILAVPRGRASETPPTAGLFSLWSRSLTRGSRRYSYEDLTRVLEDMAGSLSAFAGRHNAGIAGSFLSRDWAKGLDLLAEVWLHPSFPAAQVSRAQKEQLAALRSQQDSPVTKTFLRVRELVYPGHPYAFNTQGSKKNVLSFSSKQLADLHQRLKGPGGAVLVVVGDVDPAHVLAKARALFGKLKGKVTRPKLPRVPLPKAPRREKLAQPKARQTQVVLVYPAPDTKDPRRFAAVVLRAVLGGMGGRLFMDLREKRSLAYSVSPFYSAYPLGGVFGVYLAVGPGKEQAALVGLREQLQRVAAAPPSSAEMARAKGYVIGTMAIGLQSYGSQAASMASNELLGRGYDYHRKVPGLINAVTAAQVQALARQVLQARLETRLLAGPLGQKKVRAP